MNAEMIVMRVVHILAGVIWAGSAVFLAVVLDPRLRTLSTDIQSRVTASLAPAVRPVLEASGAVTILVGVLLVHRMERLDDLFDTNWGWAMLLGFVASILAFTGQAVMMLTSKKLVRAHQETPGAPFTPEEQARMDRLSNRVTLLARITAALVVIAVAAMASARFVG